MDINLQLNNFLSNYREKQSLLISPFLQITSLIGVFYFIVGDQFGFFGLTLIATVIFIISGNFYLSILSPFIAVAVATQLIKFNFFNTFWIGNSFNQILLYLIVLCFLISAILRLTIGRTINREITFLEQFLPIPIILIFISISQQISSLTKPESLRFLVSTGEDNAAWLLGLSRGFTGSDSGYEFTVPMGNDVRSTTHLFLFLAREISSFGTNNFLLTENALVLQQFTIKLLIISSLVSTFFALKYLFHNKYPVALSISLSTLIGFAVYFSLTSFAMFGHLTPIISIFLLIIALSLASFENSLKSESKFRKFLFVSLIFFVLLAAGDAWWPVMPAVYLSILLALIQLFSKILRNNNYLKGFFNLFFFIATIVALYFFYYSSDTFLDFLNNYVANLGTLVHIPGGTLTPGIFHIISISVSVLLLWSIKGKDSLSNSILLRAISLSLLFYYLLTVIVSLVTSPYTLDYAANKLGLFMIAALIPIEILIFAASLKQKIQSMLGALTVFIAGSAILLNFGSPTYSGNPSWNQLTFPLVLKNNIEKQDTYVWEQALIEKIDQNPGKRVICFNRNVIPIEMRTDILTLEYKCSKYAAALQGFLSEDFTQYWLQVNLGASSPKEFLDRIPGDFFTDYEVLYIDVLVEAPKNSVPNSISELLES